MSRETLTSFHIYYFKKASESSISHVFLIFHIASATYKLKAQKNRYSGGKKFFGDDNQISERVLKIFTN